MKSTSFQNPKIGMILFLFTLVNGSLFGSDSRVQAQLIAEHSSIQPGQSFTVAVRLEMKEHWHTYWRNPGDSGLPPSVVWTLPAGFESGEIQWPYPQVFVSAGEVNYGYSNTVLLLTEISVPETAEKGSTARIEAHVDWLVCRDECIPGHADVQMELPITSLKPEKEARWAEDFRRTRASLPRSAEGWNFAASAKEDLILLSVRPPQGSVDEIENVCFFPERGDLIDHGVPQELRPSEGTLVLALKRSRYSTELPAELQGILLVSQAKDGLLKKTALRMKAEFKDQIHFEEVQQ